MAGWRPLGFSDPRASPSPPQARQKSSESGSSPGPSRPVSRRGFLRASAAGVLAGATGLPLLLSACGQAAPPAGGGSSGSGGAGTAGGAGPYPTYLPFSGGPRPDYHLDDPRYDDG